MYVVIRHTNDDGDSKYYHEELVGDVVFASRERAQEKADLLNEDTWEAIKDSPGAELTEEWLGYRGSGWCLNFYTVKEMKVIG